MKSWTSFNVEAARLAAAPFRNLRPDVLPQVPELRHLAAGDVVGHRHARQLHVPEAMASITEKSLPVHGNSVPSR